MSDAPVPAAAGVSPVVGVEPPPNPFVKALKDALAALKKEATDPNVDKTVITGVLGFLSAEFPPAAPFLGLAEAFLLKLLGLA